MTPVISVIVCTYNQEQTISRTLDSILAQKCQVPIEIIIGEDCSTDGTLPICKAYADANPDTIRLLQNERNKGLIDNYYDCLLACKGKYIAECAGDDYWIDDYKLAKALQLIESNPEISLVHTDWQYFNCQTNETFPSGNEAKNISITDGKKLLEDILTPLSRPTIHLCTALYRKDLIIKSYNENTYLFRNKDFGCEDIQVCFMAALNGKIGYIPDITLSYSIGKPSISSAPDDKKQFDFVKKTTSLSVYLADLYQCRTPKVENYIEKKLFALSMHAFRSHSAQLRAEVCLLVKKWHASMPMKAKVVQAIAKYSWSWNAALIFRKCLLKLKK